MADARPFADILWSVALLALVLYATDLGADLRNNNAMSEEYVSYMKEHCGVTVPTNLAPLGSTDFGNVSYVLPALHPIFGVRCAFLEYSCQTDVPAAADQHRR